MNKAKNTQEIVNRCQKSEGIIPLWQPVGYSTYQIANAISQKLNKKVTHTGVLDPLAEGVVLFLVGDERFRKQEHSEYTKGYDFDIAVGLETDSFDALGVLSPSSRSFFEMASSGADSLKSPINGLDKNEIQTRIDGFKGVYTQEVPLYSAQKVNGKKLFLYPKEGLTPPYIPKKSGFIKRLEYKGKKQVKLVDLVSRMIDRINEIDSGQFRQEEVKDQWSEVLKEAVTCCDIADSKLPELSFFVELTRGLYVRSLSQDIVKLLGCIGFVSRLERVFNGPYNKGNSLTLGEFFGAGFDRRQIKSKFKLPQKTPTS